MKNLFLLSLAAACVCACAQNASSEAVYEWEGVKLSYDSARYEIRELDEDYGVNFDLVEKEKPENWMHFAIHRDARRGPGRGCHVGHAFPVRGRPFQR